MPTRSHTRRLHRTSLRPALRAAGLLACAGLTLCVAGFSAAQEAPTTEPAEVVIQADQPAGRFTPERFTNASLDAVYSQTTSPLADPAFQWIRATNALSYVRCYNWLGDGIPKGHPEWFSGARVARVGPDGQPVYQWEGLERVLDTLVASGLKPMIVCGGMPDALAEGPVRRNEGGMAVNRPKDYARYGDMIAQMLRRLEKTYGAKEVRTWYFEVWSQPDHEGSWEGGRPAPFQGETTAAAVAPFTRLYDQFAAAMDSVDPKVPIGGPGLAGDVSFLRRFLTHCVRGTNSVDGRRGARLDFVSWHRYGPVGDVTRWNAELAGIVEKEFPELKSAQLVLSESGGGPVEGERANTAYEAARLAALIDANARSPRGVDMIFRSGDLIDDHFDGHRPLITRLGDHTLPMPALRLYMLLTRMGSQRLKTEVPAGVGALAARPEAKGQQGAVQALLYRYDPSVAPGAGKPQRVRARFTGLPANLVRLPMRVYQVDAAHHAVYEAWVAAGKPRPAPAELGEKLLGERPFDPDREELSLPIKGGVATVELDLPANGVALVTLGAETSYEVALSPRGERLRQAEAEFSAAADLQAAGEHPKAVEALRKIQKRYADTYWREVALQSLVGLYELDLRAPTQAEAVRKEMLALPLDDFLRLRLLERLRVDAQRAGGTVAVADYSRQIAEIEARLAAQREWPLKRHTAP